MFTIFFFFFSDDFVTVALNKRVAATESWVVGVRRSLAYQ